MAIMDIIVRAEDQASQVLDAVDDDVAQIGTTGEKTGTKLEKAFSKAADKAEALGKKMATRVTLPILAAGLAAFKLGSDLSESLSQASVVFGVEAGKIISASENMDDAFSQAEFLGFAGNIGDIAQGLGIAQEESDDLALSVLSLGQDLSSFKNVPVEQAVNAITSALTGERESLKGLGIVLKDTDVKQRALELGLWDGTEALSSAAQASATMSLIMEKSANSIGDFAATSEGAANKARILKANLLDQAAAMGTKLLPIGQKILGWLDKMIRGFSNLPDGVQNVVLVVLGLAAAIGPLLIVGAKLVKAFQVIKGAMVALNITMSLNPFVLLALAIVALVVLVVLNWDRIKEVMGAAFEWLKGAVSSVAEFFTGAWQRIFEFVSGTVDKIVAFHKELPGKILNAIKALAIAVFKFILKWHPIAILTRLFIENWPAIRDFFTELPGKIIDALKALSSTVHAFLVKWHPIAILWRAIQAVWPSVKSWLGQTASRIIGALSGLAIGVFNFIKDKNPVTLLFNAVVDFWPTFIDYIKSIPQRILISLRGLGSLLFNIGEKIISGLLDGIKEGWKKVTGFVGKIGGWIVDLKGPAGVDAVLLTKNGQRIMDGLLGGLRKNWPQVQAFMSARGSDLESALGSPTLGVSGVGAMGAGSLVGFADRQAELTVRVMKDSMREQNDLLRKILAKTGFTIDGRDMVDVLGKPLVEELRQRTGL